MNCEETLETTKCPSAVSAVMLDWLFVEVGTVHRSASRTYCHSAANETPRHGRDSRWHCDARGENDSGRASSGGFSCFAESNRTSCSNAVQCDCLTTASTGYHRLLRARSFHSLRLPVAARSAAPVVVAPGHSTSSQARVSSEHRRFAILPDPARIGSARHQMVLQECR